jgi:NAD+ diphosphatase
MIIDARWYTRAEIQAVLDHPTGTRFGDVEYKKMAESTEGRNNQQGTIPDEINIDGPPFKLPPVTAIAGVLIRDWAEGRIGFPRDNGRVTQPLYKGLL